MKLKCACCGQYKDRDAFYQSLSFYRGRDYYCHECRKTKRAGRKLTGSRQRVVSAKLLSRKGDHRRNIPLGNIWELTLECGHTVVRYPRYPRDGRPHPGWHGERRDPADAICPRFAKCEICEQEKLK